MIVILSRFASFGNSMSCKCCQLFCILTQSTAFIPPQFFSEDWATILASTHPSTLSTPIVNDTEGELICWSLQRSFSPLTPSASTSSLLTSVVLLSWTKKAIYQHFLLTILQDCWNSSHCYCICLRLSLRLERSWINRHLKQQTALAWRRQPEMWHFFGDVSAHTQQVVTWRCPEVENVRKWHFTSRRTTWVHVFVLILLTCFCAIFVPNQGKVA